MVQGRLKVRTEVREGQSWTSADIDAVAIGHDLARGTGVPATRPDRRSSGDTATDPASRRRAEGGSRKAVGSGSAATAPGGDADQD